MDNDKILVVVLVALSAFFIVSGCIYLVVSLLDRGKQSVFRKIQGMDEDLPGGGLHLRQLEGMTPISRFFYSFAVVRRMAVLVAQSNLPFKLWQLVGLSFVCAACGWLGAEVLGRPTLAPIGAMGLGALPALSVLYVRHKRYVLFAAQLPEALDAISRALQAGHTFTGGLRLVVEEFPPPISTEFGRAVEEITYGGELENAMVVLSQRVENEDLNFFVSSLLIQHKSGGNLREVTETIATMIRENVKFQGKIRSLTAEARYSSYLLCLMPFFMAFILQLRNPTYLEPFFTTETGDLLLKLGIGGVVVGYFVMQRMARIEV